MPNTYTELRRTVVGTATSSVTFDLTGISGYTDLRVVINGACDTGAANVLMRYNNDSTSTLYSATWLTGDGASATSGRNGTQNQIILNYYGYLDTTYRTNVLVDIFQYANTNVFKTNISRANNAANGTSANTGLWRNTAAITSITFVTGSNNFAVGTTFSLYGIANADQGAAKATGGIITEDSQYWYHTFGASGTFIPKQSLTCDVLVVAGGGGGGSGLVATDVGAGGGAGGFREFASQVLTATNYNVVIGGGGGNSVNGNNSSFDTLTASGGGRGGQNSNGAGGSGGSGGGGRGVAGTGGAGGSGNAGNYTPVEGYAGSQGNNSGPNYGGGAGGGAAAVGGAASSTSGGAGGAGKTSSYSGTANSYAGGGGGGVYLGGSGGAGGAGGGGAGGNAASNGTAGTANRGGGGGGGGSNGASGTGGAGGSGIVIVRYAK
jgi:hypothetical protein